MSDSRKTPAGQLSPREIEVVKLVAADLSDKEIAQVLSISEKTVKSHLVRIRAATQKRSRVGLTLLAVREGWVFVAPNCPWDWELTR